MGEDRGEVALRWLRALAEDVLDHDCCHGCKVNAAQSLDELGLLQDVLTSLAVEDPRPQPWGGSPTDG